MGYHQGLAATILFASSLLAASKPQVVVLGKWTTVKLQADDDSSAIDAKIRSLFVDAKSKEFTLGNTHEITQRIFVVQRMFRLNDSLPPGVRSRPLALGKGRLASCGSRVRQSATDRAAGVRSQLFPGQLVS